VFLQIWEISHAGVYQRAAALRVIRPFESIGACRSCFDVVRGLAKPPSTAGVTAGMH
jgi:hypothetical protein